MAAACDRFRTGVLEDGLTHDGHPALARHVGHCVAKDTALRNDREQGRARQHPQEILELTRRNDNAPKDASVAT